MTPRLRLWGDGNRVELLMVRRTVCGFGEGFGADNDQVGFVAVEFENLMSARQLAVVMELVEM